MTERSQRSPDAVRLGNTIRIGRRNQGLRQADLADRINRSLVASGSALTCSRSAVTHWEVGDWMPDFRLLPHIAAAIGVPTELLHMILEGKDRAA